MKLIVATAAVVLHLAGHAPAFAQAGTDEVEQVLKAFLVPFSGQDVAEFIDYFAEDAVAFFPSSAFDTMRVEGKANIARTFAKVFKPGRPAPASGRPLIQPQDLKIQRFGDSAVATFHLGSDATRGRRSFVLHRIDAKWRIVHLHASSIVAPVAAQEQQVIDFSGTWVVVPSRSAWQGPEGPVHITVFGERFTAEQTQGALTIAIDNERGFTSSYRRATACWTP